MTSPERYILCVGLTPAVQRTLIFADTPRIGAVNRAGETLVTPSGKAANVARVITQLGGQAHLVTLLGGESGRWFEREWGTTAPLSAVWAQDDAPTRTCTTLLGANESTELVEESRPVSANDNAKIIETVRDLLPDAACLSLSGSLPPGTPPDLYRTLTLMAHDHDIPCAVDTQGEPFRLALEAQPFFVKPNLAEAQRTFNLPVTGDERKDMTVACLRMLSDDGQPGADWALVTHGAQGAMLVSTRTETAVFLNAPALIPVNTIGAGDSLLAGFLQGCIQKRMEFVEAARWGMACASANCLTPTSGNVYPADVENYFEKITVS